MILGMAMSMVVGECLPGFVPVLVFAVFQPFVHKPFR
jgi:hypothetical protein